MVMGYHRNLHKKQAHPPAIKGRMMIFKAFVWLFFKMGIGIAYKYTGVMGIIVSE